MEKWRTELMQLEEVMTMGECEDKEVITNMAKTLAFKKLLTQKLRDLVEEKEA